MLSITAEHNSDNGELEFYETVAYSLIAVEEINALHSAVCSMLFLVSAR